ncbi:Papain inhibitor precursor [Streptomyces sp. YIM 121038]|uniref:cysteine/serine endopeptidase inhibitor n=1 Tax=Streptomyces sp. YIM 121038 TaxID=2136401 RepID=UPI0011100969|nr:cysteine/serine endopeptidase inhibitor [Streptomyces sp. YIM 121038]QCX74194.1 Papain inhibitor precursor [Streptomyces sp. YIM 121038]
MRLSRCGGVLATAVVGVALSTGPARADIPIGRPMSGKATYYGIKGYGACGTPLDPTAQDLVAVSAAWWTGPNPNNDPLCRGVEVRVTYQGRTITVPVRDKCPSCASTHIDLGEAAFRRLAPLETGVISGLTWKFVR